jgi:hypothetical protein
VFTHRRLSTQKVFLFNTHKNCSNTSRLQSEAQKGRRCCDKQQRCGMTPIEPCSSTHGPQVSDLAGKCNGLPVKFRKARQAQGHLESVAWVGVTLVPFRPFSISIPPTLRVDTQDRRIAYQQSNSQQLDRWARASDAASPRCFRRTAKF